MFDHNIVDLKKRLKDSFTELDATSHPPVIKVVQWATEQSPFDSPDMVVQIQGLKGKYALFASSKLANVFRPKGLSEDPVLRFPCFESQG